MGRKASEITIYTRQLKNRLSYQVYFRYYDDDGEARAFRKAVPKGYTKDQALALGRKWRDELVKGTRPGVTDPTPSPLLKDFYDTFLDEHVAVHLSASVLKTRRSIGRIKLKPTLGNTRLSKITVGDVNRLIAKLQEQGDKPSYINQVLSALNQCFQYAVAVGVMEGDSVPKIPRLKAGRPSRKEILEPTELDAVFDALEGQDRNFFRVMARTGLRRGEVVGLRFSDISWKRGVMRIERSIEHDKSKKENAPKSQKPREVPMHEDVRKALKAQQKLVVGDICFPDPRDHGEYLTPGQRNRLLERARKRSGVERLTYHLLRHTAASRMVNSGGNLRAVQEILGHHDISVTARYLHVDATHMQAAVDLL